MEATDAKPSLPAGYKPGLEGVIAGVSAISEVDAERDTLIYRGYAAHELAEKASFEEVAYLLLHGKLPTASQLSAFISELIPQRGLDAKILSVLKSLPPDADPMTALSVGVSTASMLDPDREKNDAASNLAKAKRLVAKSPSLVAAFQRISKGQEPLAPNAKLGHAANFLFMLSGKEPDLEIARTFDSTMILYAEHGYNASTFAALVTASTLSDMYFAVASAIGALKGPLHGGANERAIEVILEIGKPENVEPWLKAALARKEKIMGFGHRVYKHQDSRAPFMKGLAKKMAERTSNMMLFDLSCRLEEAMKREKNLFPNVDFHCAVVYYLMGLPIPIYTPIFAISRMPGWTAHIIEQHSANRLIRPECIYAGARGLAYVPIEKR